MWLNLFVHLELRRIQFTFRFIAPVFPGKPGMFLISPLIGPQQLLFLFPANEKRALIFLRPREAS